MTLDENGVALKAGYFRYSLRSRAVGIDNDSTLHSTGMAAYVQDVFMLFGDSITQGGWELGVNGFGQRLSHFYARKLDVLNRGLSGYNTEWGIPVFEKILAKKSEVAPQIRILTIWFGANDACIKPSPQHVPLDKFKENLTRMVETVTSPDSPQHSPGTRIILISPPPVNTIARRADLESRNPPLKLDREFDITRRYADAVREVAVAQGVAFVDVWTAIWEAAGQSEPALSQFLGDGLHLNGDGYNIMYEELMKTIVKEYPEVHYDNIEYVFPPWADLIA